MFQMTERHLEDLQPTWLQKASRLTYRFKPARNSPYGDFIQAVNAEYVLKKQQSPTQWAQELNHCKLFLRKHGLIEQLLVTAFALVKCYCEQTLNKSPYDTQLLAARTLLSGNLAEMATGEGKTISMGLAAAVAGLTGFPIYVLTSNDYLAERDSEELEPLFQALGLSVSFVAAEMSAQEKLQRYSANIIYATAKTLAFDYLYEQIQQSNTSGKQGLGQQHQYVKGLYYALVDEADSLLIDDANTPLILSTSSNNTSQIETYQQALFIAQQLEAHSDYVINQTQYRVTLTDAGKAKTEPVTQTLKGLWQHPVFSQELLETALCALYCYHNQIDYIIQDDKIQIIDQMTGRIAEGRVWSKGLHNLIEIKEKLPASGEMVTIAQISFQRFFNLFHCLGGMSGTLHEVRQELFEIYGLKIYRIPLHKPSLRKQLPIHIFSDANNMYRYLQAQVYTMQQQGRAILIGTDSIQESQIISQVLQQANIAHQILNALNHKQEAQMIALAGQTGAVTIATNMAGRGTDIKISAQVKQQGGLHVISCQHNLAYRNDRQLIGRAARHGDPGSYEFIMMLQKNFPNPNLLEKAFITLAHVFPSLRQKLYLWPKFCKSYFDRKSRSALYKQDLQEMGLLLSINNKI